MGASCARGPIGCGGEIFIYFCIFTRLIENLLKFDLDIGEAVSHKVDILIILILIRLYGGDLWLESLVLGLIGKCMN